MQLLSQKGIYLFFISTVAPMFFLHPASGELVVWTDKGGQLVTSTGTTYDLSSVTQIADAESALEKQLEQLRQAVIAAVVPAKQSFVSAMTAEEIAVTRKTAVKGQILAAKKTVIFPILEHMATLVAQRASLVSKKVSVSHVDAMAAEQALRATEALRAERLREAEFLLGNQDRAIATAKQHNDELLALREQLDLQATIIASILLETQRSDLLARREALLRNIQDVQLKLVPESNPPAIIASLLGKLVGDFRATHEISLSSLQKGGEYEKNLTENRPHVEAFVKIVQEVGLQLGELKGKIEIFLQSVSTATTAQALAGASKERLKEQIRIYEKQINENIVGANATKQSEEAEVAKRDHEVFKRLSDVTHRAVKEKIVLNTREWESAKKRLVEHIAIAQGVLTELEAIFLRLDSTHEEAALSSLGMQVSQEFAKVSALSGVITELQGKYAVLLRAYEDGVKALTQSETAAAVTVTLAPVVGGGQAAAVTLAPQVVTGIAHLLDAVRMGNRDVLAGQPEDTVNIVEELDKFLPPGADPSVIASAIPVISDFVVKRDALLKNITSAQVGERTVPNHVDFYTKKMASLLGAWQIKPFYDARVKVVNPTVTAEAASFVSFLDDLYCRSRALYEFPKCSDLILLREGIGGMGSPLAYFNLAFQREEASRFALVGAQANYVELFALKDGSLDTQSREIGLFQRSGDRAGLAGNIVNLCDRVNDIFNFVLFRNSAQKKYSDLLSGETEKQLFAARAAANYAELYDNFLRIFEPHNQDKYHEVLVRFLEMADFPSITERCVALRDEMKGSVTPVLQNWTEADTAYRGISARVKAVVPDLTNIAAHQADLDALGQEFTTLMTTQVAQLILPSNELVSQQVDRLKVFFDTSTWFDNGGGVIPFVAEISPFQAIVHTCVDTFPGLYKNTARPAIDNLYRFLCDFVAVKKPVICGSDVSQEERSAQLIAVGLAAAFDLPTDGLAHAGEFFDRFDRYVMTNVVIHPHVIPTVVEFVKPKGNLGLLSLIRMLRDDYVQTDYEKCLSRYLRLSSEQISGLLPKIIALHERLKLLAAAPQRDINHQDLLGNMLAVQQSRDLEKTLKSLKTLKKYKMAKALAEKADEIAARITAVLAGQPAGDVENAAGDIAVLGDPKERAQLARALFAQRIEALIAGYKKGFLPLVSNCLWQNLETAVTAAPTALDSSLGLFLKQGNPWLLAQAPVGVVDDICLPCMPDGQISVERVAAAVKVPVVVPPVTEFKVQRKLLASQPIELADVLEKGSSHLVMIPGEARRIDLNPSTRFARLYEAANRCLGERDFSGFVQHMGVLHYVQTPAFALRSADLEFILNGGDVSELIALLEADNGNMGLPDWVEYAAGTGISKSCIDLLQDYFSSPAAAGFIKDGSVVLSVANIEAIGDQAIRAILQVLYRNEDTRESLAAALTAARPKSFHGTTIPGKTDGLVAISKKLQRMFDSRGVEDLDIRSYARILFDWMGEQAAVDFSAGGVEAITSELVRNILITLSDRTDHWQVPLGKIFTKVKAGKAFADVKADFASISKEMDKQYDLDSIDLLSEMPVVAPVAAVLPPVAHAAVTTRGVDALIALVEAKDGGFTADNIEALGKDEMEGACAALGAGFEKTSKFTKGIVGVIGGFKQQGKRLLLTAGGVDAIKVELRKLFPDPKPVVVTPVVAAPPPVPGPGLGVGQAAATYMKIEEIVRFLQTKGCLKAVAAGRVALDTVTDVELDAAVPDIPVKWKNGLNSWRKKIQSNALDKSDANLSVDEVLAASIPPNSVLKLLFPDPKPAVVPVAVAPLPVAHAGEVADLGKMLKLQPFSHWPTEGECVQLLADLMRYYQVTTPSDSALLKKYAAILKPHPGIKKFGAKIPKPALQLITQYQICISFLEDAEKTRNSSRLITVFGDAVKAKKIRYFRRPKCRVSDGYISYLKNPTVKKELMYLSQFSAASKNFALDRPRDSWQKKMLAVANKMHQLFGEYCSTVIQSIDMELQLLVRQLAPDVVDHKAIDYPGQFSLTALDVASLDSAFVRDIGLALQLFSSDPKAARDRLLELSNSVIMGAGGGDTQALATHIKALLDSVNSLLSSRNGLYMIVDGRLFEKVDPYRPPTQDALAGAFELDAQRSAAVMKKYGKKQAVVVHAGHHAGHGGALPPPPPGMMGPVPVVQAPVGHAAAATLESTLKTQVSAMDHTALAAWRDATTGLGMLHALARSNGYVLTARASQDLWLSILAKAGVELVLQVDENGDSILFKLVQEHQNLEASKVVEILKAIIDKAPEVLVLANPRGECAFDFMLEKFSFNHLDKLLPTVLEKKDAVKFVAADATPSARRTRTLNQTPLMIFLKSFIDPQLGSRIRITDSGVPVEMEINTGMISLFEDANQWDAIVDAALPSRSFTVALCRKVVKDLVNLSPARHRSDPCRILVVDSVLGAKRADIADVHITVVDYLIYFFALLKLKNPLMTDGFGHLLVRDLQAMGYLSVGVVGGALYRRYTNDADAALNVKAAWESIFQDSLVQSRKKNLERWLLFADDTSVFLASPDGQELKTIPYNGIADLCSLALEIVNTKKIKKLSKIIQLLKTAAFDLTQKIPGGSSALHALVRTAIEHNELEAVADFGEGVWWDSRDAADLAPYALVSYAQLVAAPALLPLIGPRLIADLQAKLGMPGYGIPQGVPPMPVLPDAF